MQYVYSVINLLSPGISRISVNDVVAKNIVRQRSYSINIVTCLRHVATITWILWIQLGSLFEQLQRLRTTDITHSFANDNT
jgi:hypothetical protein